MKKAVITIAVFIGACAGAGQGLADTPKAIASGKEKPAAAGESCRPRVPCTVGLACVGRKCVASEDRVANCKAALSFLADMLEMYYYSWDEYPSELGALTRKRKYQRRAMMWETELLDPWRAKFRYVRNGDDFELCSSGPDGNPGTADDICWVPPK